jgi:uncharacterized protein (DUF1330 family)
MPNTEVDAVNPPAFDELRKRADDGPVQMLNLLDFKKPGGAERYAEYSAGVAPLLEKIGARVLYAGSSSGALIGPSEWDLVAVVEYPTRRAFIEMTSSPEYLEIAHLRTEALERAELHPLDRVEAPTTSA